MSFAFVRSTTVLAVMAVGVLSVALAAPAEAKDICVGGPKEKWLNPGQISEIVRKLGYGEFVLAFEDGCFEAKIVNADQSRTEVYLDPVSGEVIKTKHER